MKLVSRTTLDELSDRARAVPRQRAHHNLHEDHDAPVQRLFVALQPGTYVRPHRHPDPNKWELLMGVRGRLAVLLFEDDGRVRERLELGPDQSLLAVEIPPGTWHSAVALEPDSVMMELKEGPYVPTPAEGFAAWAPPEGDPAAPAFERWLRRARAGERPQAEAVS